MLAMPRMRTAKVRPDPSSSGLQNIVTYEGAPSPRELLENIVIQAQAALRGLSAGEKPKSENGEDGVEPNQSEDKDDKKDNVDTAQKGAAAELRSFWYVQPWNCV